MEESARQDADIKTELNVKFTGTEEDRLNSVNREHTVVFGMPNKGH